ncbi:MAG: hypothetical protein U9P90_02005 [Patescibacteria group bacterium]|nr:hypothetical protein [Patescibacteria group bacterium]
MIFKWNNIDKKNEMILNLIKDTIKKNKSVLVLEPRLQNVNYMQKILDTHKGCPYIYHSKLKKTEKWDVWKNAIEGKIKIIIATRHGVFLPLKNLGLIIFDDEEDDDFTSINQKPYYDARTIAELRNVEVVSFSQSPRVGTIFQELDENKIKPEITIVDLKTGDYSPISYTLKKAIRNTLQKGKKVVLFLNRKGETGIEKLEKELRKNSPAERIIRVDKDSNTNFEDIKKSNIIIGTEYLYKNYLYPKNQIKGIDLIVLPKADTLFNHPDFRTDERAFAWIVKFSNLAEQESAKFIVQTYSPENQVLRLACQNSLDFYKREYEIRKKFGYVRNNHTS